MPIPLPWKKEKTEDELLEENKRLSLVYSNEEIRAAIREAKQKYGVTPKSFGNNIVSFMKWFKSH